MKKVFAVAVLIAMLFVLSAPASAKKTKAPKKIAQKHAALATHALVRAPRDIAKIIAYGFLFGTEAVIVDPAHITLAAVDRFGDITHLSSFPPLDMIYAGISIANTDLALADLWEENTETVLFGHHN